MKIFSGGKNYSLLIAALILLSGICVLVYVNFFGYDVAKETRKQDLNTGLFDDFATKIISLGAVAVPLGETETVREAVVNTLRFDRGGYWRVSTSSGDLWIYAAYWGLGKQTIREIAFHTPDHCWIDAGWAKEVLPAYDQLAGQRLIEVAKQRCYRAGNVGGLAYVSFWHFVNGQVVDYGDRTEPSKISLLTSLWTIGLNQKSAQWFVRVHSTVPLAKLQNTPAMVEVLNFVNQIAPGGHVLEIQ